MNKSVLIPTLLVLILSYGCSSTTTQSESIQETVVTFVVDCTDPELFESIDRDFRTNLNSFFRNLNLNQLDYGKKLTVKMLPLEASGTVSANGASIGPATRNMSKRKAASCRDTRPLCQLIATELNTYRTLSESDVRYSSILETLLKTFMEMNPESEREIIVLLSDGIEHSNFLNMYRSSIPTTDDAVERLANRLDPFLLQSATSRICLADPVVVMVLKKNDRVNNIDLKQFYSKFLNNVLGIKTSNILFVDNLGNNIQIPKEP
ncbi:MAG: hypothetical protein J6W30_01440 [Bacteroidales bacterium]|nr:hypothetical protein [Bacteroidales bacterium]